MVVRRGLNRTFSFETGINYIDRNYRLNASNSTINLNDFTDFSLRSYEIPYQLLTNVQVSENIYLNVAFGFHIIYLLQMYTQRGRKIINLYKTR